MEGTISESNVVKGKIYGNTLSAGVGAILAKDGRSAYEVAVANGFEGSETEWLESLRGEQGVPGVPGEVGETGATGEDGKSAYEIALDHGFNGTEEEWLESLKGEDGEITEEIKQEIASMVDLTGYAKTADIPTKVSSLENDKGYLTEHQSLDGYALKADIPSLDGYAKTTDIPDVSEFATLEDVEAKGYQTEEQVLELIQSGEGDDGIIVVTVDNRWNTSMSATEIYEAAAQRKIVVLNCGVLLPEVTASVNGSTVEYVVFHALTGANGNLLKIQVKVVGNKGTPSFVPVTADDVGAVSIDDVEAQVQEEMETTVREIPSVTFKVGQNVLTDDIVTLGAGWSGNLADGFTHTSGSTEPLTFAINSVDGESYFIGGNTPVTGATLYHFAIGDSPLTDPYNHKPTIAWGVKSVGGGDFKIIPQSGFSGTLTNLSCKKITEDGAEEVTVLHEDIGHAPNADHISGPWNVYIGPDVLTSIVNGTRNIGIGRFALRNLKTGGRNIAIGTSSLNEVEYAENNIIIGADCGLNAATATGNVGMGKAALYYGANLTDNVAIGREALYGLGTLATDETTDNIAIGTKAGYKNASNSNVFIGREAGYNSTANQNTCVGNRAGKTLTSGWGNTFIGTGADASAGSYNKSIAVGRSAKVTKSYQAVFGGDDITETLLKGNLVVRGTDGVKRQIVFNEDGTCGWTTV